MKTLNIIPLVASFILAAFLTMPGQALAQKTKTETIPVSGNCGMCKSKIENAAKTAGVKTAKWDAETKTLTVKYNHATTNAAKIQQAIAAVGYDTRDVKATDEAYEKLHGCCKYDRAADKKQTGCCGEKCEMKDGQCNDMAACKDKGCCTAEGACKAGTTCQHAEADGAKGACCKQSH